MKLSTNQKHHVVGLPGEFVVSAASRVKNAVSDGFVGERENIPAISDRPAPDQERPDLEEHDAFRGDQLVGAQRLTLLRVSETVAPCVLNPRYRQTKCQLTQPATVSV